MRIAYNISTDNAAAGVTRDGDGHAVIRLVETIPAEPRDDADGIDAQRNALRNGIARDLIDQYSERFPAVKEFTESIVAGARKTGFTTTLFGRRRHFAEIHSQNFNRRSYSERQAMNAPIQGTAADMIKLAMIKIRPLLESGETKMLLQVHDELVFEVHEDNAAREAEKIREQMCSALPLNVPLAVDTSWGRNWLEGKSH